MRILGIEFGAWSLKAVEMEFRFRKLELLDLHEIILPLEINNPTEVYRQSIEKLLARLPVLPEKIVTSLPPAQTALRFLRFPISQRKRIEQIFRFELEDNIPFKLEESIIEHLTSVTYDGSIVFAAIAPKHLIETHVGWLKDVGVDPDWLTFEGMGVLNLFLSTQRSREEVSDAAPVLLIDIGHLKTNVGILYQNRLEFYRSIAWGGLSITQSISFALNLPIEKAEEKKMRELDLELTGEALGDAISKMIEATTHAFVPFIADLQHCLVTYRSIYQREVGTLLVSGGTANLMGITDFLSKSLGIPSDLFLSFEGTSFKRKIERPQELRFGEALGRAMVFARKSALLFNFRKEELAKQTSLREVGTLLKNPNVVVLSKYITVLIIILFIHVIIALRITEKEAVLASMELKKVYQDTLTNLPSRMRSNPPKEPQELRKLLMQKNRELEQKIKMQSKTKTPFLKIIRSISDAFPPTIRIDVNVMNLQDRNFSLEGVIYGGDLKQSVELLKAVPHFANIALEQRGQRFTLKGDIRPQ